MTCATTEEIEAEKSMIEKDVVSGSCITILDFECFEN